MREMARVTTAAVVLTLCLAFVAQAGTVTGSGKQTRGVPGRDGQLLGGSFVIPNGVTARITDANCDCDGFWIEGPVKKTFNNPAAARGQMLGAGKYRVLPNLKPRQNEANVSVTLSW